MARAFLVQSQVQGRKDLNDAYPKRLTDRRYTDSDGWVADKNHKPPSEHIPDKNGAVRATDNDIDAIPHPLGVVASMCAHPATRYVIYQNGIWHQRNGFRRAAYTGAWHGHIHRTTNPTPAADNNTTRLKLPGLAPGTVPVAYIPTRGTGGGITRFAVVRQHRTRSTAAARTLQRAANKLGARLKVDGIAGAHTAAWVWGFQREHKLKIDGVAGGATWAAIAQALLNAHGHALKIDGAFGRNSKAATLATQKAYGLTPDGWFGSRTMARLIA